MANKNLGKKFESLIGDSFRALPDVSVDRIPDQTMHHKGRTNVSDFIVYKYPYQYYVECKSIHGNTLPIANITQFWPLWEKQAHAKGVEAGVLCWWVDKDVTRWIPICEIATLKGKGVKSIRFDEPIEGSKTIAGRKKKVYFEYDMKTFFE